MILKMRFETKSKRVTRNKNILTKILRKFLEDEEIMRMQQNTEHSYQNAVKLAIKSKNKNSNQK